MDRNSRYSKSSGNHIPQQPVLSDQQRLEALERDFERLWFRYLDMEQHLYQKEQYHSNETRLLFDTGIRNYVISRQYPSLRG
jgi:hypothetical protein